MGVSRVPSATKTTEIQRLRTLKTVTEVRGEQTARKYAPVVMIILIVSGGFGILGGVESLLAFLAVSAIPMIVLLTVALVQWLTQNLRLYLGQLISRRRKR